MASVLLASGFKNVETLTEFSSRFPNMTIHFDEDLKKIWICHKNPDDIPNCENLNFLPSMDYLSLHKQLKKKINKEKMFYSLHSEFSVLEIFNTIYNLFHKHLTTYLFTKCYLFYNWGISAFEPLIDHFEIHKKIEEKENISIGFNQKRFNFHQNFLENLIKVQKKWQNDSKVENTQGTSKYRSVKPVSCKSVIEAFKKAEKFYDISKNSLNSYQEMFTLTRILYDTKERSGWPKNHILSRYDVNNLLEFIINVPVVTKTHIEDVLLIQYNNWGLLRELLEKFIKNHENVNKNNGYGRILKKHLKNVETTPGRRLHPIPKSIVCSYVLCILRKVLPFQLFGWNRVRKKFFSELIKVLKGNKDESFIWYTLLRSLLLKKSDLAWCTQLGDNYTQSQVLLKLFKFIIIHYVFVLVRNNFYVTEIGSSGFGLRYYRKSDMHSASFACLKNLLENGNIKRLGKNDYERPTVERKWLNSGVIEVEDLKMKLKNSMYPNTEYRQPIAHIRFLPKNECSDELRIITRIIKKHPKRFNEPVADSKRLKKFFEDRLSKRNKNLFLVKLFLDYLVDNTIGIRPLPSNTKLEAAWKKVACLKEKYGKLYFVKADISGAFDSVNYQTLKEILRGALEKELESGTLQLKKIYEWKKGKLKIEKDLRFSYSNRPKENRIMISRSLHCHPNKTPSRSIDMKILEIIQQVVMEQKVEIMGKVFKLIRGLAQGSAGKFSPKLCEIYYSSMDNLHFSEFINSNDCVLLRGVDDYLFISSNLDKSKQFLELVQNGITDYNVKFKKHKLKSNLIEDIQEVSYLGLSFNLEHLFVKPNYSKYQAGDVLSSMNLSDKWGSNHFKKRIFLQRRSSCIKCLKLTPIVIGGIHNNLKIMRQIFFEACLMQSLRVMTLADYLYSDSVKDDSGVFQVLLISCSKMKKLVATCRLSVEELNWIFFFAASFISRKYSGQFKLLSLLIRFRMQKCEKAFSENGARFLLEFLKDDLLNDEYWEKITSSFPKLGKPPRYKV